MKGFLELTFDEAKMLTFPDDLSRFFNEQLHKICKQSIYPHSEIFPALMKKGQISNVNRSREEKRQAVLFQLRIGCTEIVWACKGCRRIIGLIEKMPKTLKAKYSHLTQELIGSYFAIYAAKEYLQCPHCQSVTCTGLLPNFLISARSLDSQVDHLP